MIKRKKGPVARRLKESRPGTKDTKTSGKSTAGKTGGKGSKSPTRQSKTGSKASTGKGADDENVDVDDKVDDYDDEDDVAADEEIRRMIGESKEYAEVAIQDEGGDPDAAVVDDKIRTPNTRHSKRAKSMLDPVQESDFDNAFDLFDEESWSAVPGDQMSGRFSQYRRLSKHRVLELEEQLQLNQAKTKRKVLTLKAQFQEHKGKWEAERKILIEQVDQSLRLQTDAEKEADAAMTQLEDFITEQERLEQEEDVKRGEILHASATLTPQEGLTPQLSSSLGTTPDGPTPRPGLQQVVLTPGLQQVVLTPESEQELQRLMQQTDDAKSARQGVGSSTSNRTSSGGSVMVGSLLDVTRPIAQKQPSPDTPSTQAVTPQTSATAKGQDSKQQQQQLQSNDGINGEESVIRIESTEIDVAEEVLNEVGLSITAQTGHVTVLKSPEEKRAEVVETVVEEETAVIAITSDVESVSFPVAHKDTTIISRVEQSENMSSYPPSGQPLPASAQGHIQGQTVSRPPMSQSDDLNLNPVILIMPGGEFKSKTEEGGVEAKLGQATAAAIPTVQAFIPGSKEIMACDSSQLEIKIIPKKEVKAEINRTMSFGQQQQQHQQHQKSPRLQLQQVIQPTTQQQQQEEEMKLDTPAGQSQPLPLPILTAALDLVSLMNSSNNGNQSQQQVTGQPTPTPIPTRPATSNELVGSDGVVVVVDGGGSGGAVSPSKLSQHDLQFQSQLQQGLQLQSVVAVTGVAVISGGEDEAVVAATTGTTRNVVGLDGIDVDVSTPRVVQELNARLGTCVSAPPAVDMDPPSKDCEVEQEVDSEDVEEEQQKFEAEVDLSQLKELPLLDIVDTKPVNEGGDISKPTSAYLLPSEATVGSSFQDQLETPLADLIEDDPIKFLKDSEKKEVAGKNPLHEGLHDDGSNLEKARSNITEREATYGDGGTESNAGGADGGTFGSEHQHSTLAATSKQATEASIVADGQKSFLRQSISSVEGMKIDGLTEEEIRTTSAQSRASLRSIYKVKLEETKSAAEERRSKSPAITLPTQLTIDAELILDEDEDDDDDDNITDEMLLDFKDPSMYEIGTSPPPGLGSRDSSLPDGQDSDERRKKRMTMKGKMTGSGPSRDPTEHYYNDMQSIRPVQKIIRKGKSLLSHPILQEYLKTYQCVISFKDSMSKMFLDKDMMSAHQLTTDLDTLTFDKGQKAMPQVEQLTKNAYYVLEEISSLITNILVYDREPPVSSLVQFSREATQKSFVQPTESLSELLVAPPATMETTVKTPSIKEEHQRRLSSSSDKVHIKDLQDQYNQMKTQLDEDKKHHQEQLQHNTVVMMGMQDTINDLQRELSTLGKAANKKSSSKPASSSSRRTIGDKPKTAEGTIMFTRLDSERNAKIMKKAVVEDKMNSEKYKEAVARMDEYVSLPAQRLTHLVKKYVHHSHMKEIEDNVKKSSSVDEEVFDVLDKMETLQNQRARQWADRMDEMGIERLRLANLLMDTLDNIEQESGIFLIKPMYSYRGRDLKQGLQGKLSRPLKSQNVKRAVTPSNDAASTFIPAPTPASNYRLVKHERHFLHQLQQHQQQAALMGEMKPSEVLRSSVDGNEVKIMGNGLTFSASSPRMTWNMQASQPWTGKEDPNAFNTPRILELDINRMMIGQNNISSRVPFPPTEDRLTNASQNSLRSYVTVNRPTAKFGGDRLDKSPGSGQQRPGSRSSPKRVRVSEADKGIPSVMDTPPPLPPITPTPDLEDGETERGEGEEEVMRPPSVAFSNEEEEKDDEGRDDDNDDSDDENDEKMREKSNNIKEPPQSPPGSSLYQSVNAKYDDADSINKPTRTMSGFSLSEDDG